MHPSLQLIGKTGDDAALPHLASLLAEPELLNSTQAAMWDIFMSCKVLLLKLGYVCLIKTLN
jgi:hypothetical protein